MKKPKIIASILISILISFIIISLCPRFGWSLGTRSYPNPMENMYYYQNSYRDSGETVVTYINEIGNTIGIAYGNRFSRHLKLYYDNVLIEEWDVQMDRGIRGKGNYNHSSLQPVSYDILASDSSGTLYWVYIKSFILIYLSMFLIVYVKKHYNRLYYLQKTLFICLTLIICLVALLSVFRLI